jgi:lysophospholipase L1-like esterase
MSPNARRRSIGLLLTGVVLGVLLVETLLRLFPIAAVDFHRRGPARAEGATFFEYDPDLGWRGRPDARGRFVGWEFTSEVRLNARGFRDRDVPADKPPDVLRILVLGDSITWGHGVEQAERYSDVLGEALRRRGLSVDVVNLAVSGYGTDQELLLWEREGRRYCPDLVLLGLYENDPRENAVAAQGRSPKPYFRLAADGVLTLENVPVPRVADWAAGEPERGLRVWLRRHVRLWAALAFVREALRPAGASSPGPPGAPPGSTELTAALIRRLAASAAEDGSVFTVVVLPDLYYSATTMMTVTRGGVASVLDLTPSFRRAAGQGAPLFYRQDGAHWTPRAHALTGEAIASWIADHRLLPASPRHCVVR